MSEHECKYERVEIHEYKYDESLGGNRRTIIVEQRCRKCERTKKGY